MSYIILQIIISHTKSSMQKIMYHLIIQKTCKMVETIILMIYDSIESNNFHSTLIFLL